MIVILKLRSIVAQFNIRQMSVQTSAAYVRKESQFRNWITADGSSGFKAEKGRYHLYVCLACPWASRCVIMRKLKGLENIVDMSCVQSIPGEGWKFTNEISGSTKDPVKGFTHLKQFYLHADPEYQGKFTVPMLWDKKQDTICSNESAEIIIMMNNQFNEFCETEEQRQLDLYPDNLKKQIDDINDYIYPRFNNGVYRSGLAKSQDVYNEATADVFEVLEKIESILQDKRFLFGKELTLADVRLFTTLIRFDLVYHTLFKCNYKKLIEYPNTQDYMQDIYNTANIADTVSRDQIVDHYYFVMESINPFRIIAKSPDLQLSVPTERRKRFSVK